MASPAPRKTHRYATPRQSVTPPRQRRMVSARPAGTPSRRTEDITAVQDVMDVDDLQMYNERVLGSGRETLYARTDEISVAFHAALPFEVRRELKGAGASVSSTQFMRALKISLAIHRFLFSILDWCS
jgi:nuclear pore complex protein Nup133